MKIIIIIKKNLSNRLANFHQLNIAAGALDRKMKCKENGHQK